MESVALRAVAITHDSRCCFVPLDSASPEGLKLPVGGEAPEGLTLPMGGEAEGEEEEELARSGAFPFPTTALGGGDLGATISMLCSYLNAVAPGLS